MVKNKLIIVLLCICSFSGKAQQILSWSQALDSAMARNTDLIQYRALAAYQQAKIATAIDLPATQFLQEFTRGVAVNVPWQSTVTQSGEWPGVYKAQHSIYSAEAKTVGFTVKDKEAVIQKALLLAHMNYAAVVHLLQELRHWDSLWASGVAYAQLRVRLGESAVLESKSIAQQHRQWQAQLLLLTADSLRYLNEWRQLCASQKAMPNITTYVWKDETSSFSEMNLSHPYLMQWNNAAIVASQQVNLEKAKLFPSWNIGFQHYPATITNTAFLGGKDAKAYVLMAGWSLPIFSRGQIARIKQAKEGVQWVEASAQAEQSRWLSNYRIALANYLAAQNNLQLYETSLLPEARQILKISAEQYKQGNITYLEWLLLAQQNLQTIVAYWQGLPAYNEKALELHYLNTNNK